MYTLEPLIFPFHLSLQRHISPDFPVQVLDQAHYYPTRHLPCDPDRVLLCPFTSPSATFILVFPAPHLRLSCLRLSCNLAACTTVVVKEEEASVVLSACMVKQVQPLPLPIHPL